jgi:hypothetical protein
MWQVLTTRISDEVPGTLEVRGTFKQIHAPVMRETIVRYTSILT